MNSLFRHWSLDPVLLVMLVTVGAYEVGLARLKKRSSAKRNRIRRRRSFFFYGGLVTLIVAIMSPIDYWASRYFYVHMLAHLLLTFFGPMLIVAGAPWVPLMFALPVRQRRAVGKFFYLSSGATPLRKIGRFFRNPWVGVGLFNTTMIFWHIPSMYDLGEQNAFIHIWLMHSSFIVSGVLFWLLVIPSYPLRIRIGPAFQVTAIVATNLIMTLLAISMSILTTVSWYTVYNHVPGVTLSPFADQQIGAAILWVCGDFWALPAIYLIIHKAIQTNGPMAQVFDRIMGRGAAPSIESFRASSISEDAELS